MKYNKILLIIVLIIVLIAMSYYNIKLYENFQSTSKNLVYYTHGFSNKFLDLLELSIRSLRLQNNNDVVVICDESFVDDCKNKLKNYTNIFIHVVKDSKSAHEASMNKLKIFDYENINNYNKILFIDSDIIVHTNLISIFNNINDDNILYVKKESDNFDDHTAIYWSLKLYTDEDLNNFKLKNIHIFNCGQFGFINSESMKIHFNNINIMINTHKGESFYEQSFMNHYFNLNQLKNETVLEEKVKLFPEKNVNYEDKIIHFCGLRETGSKMDDMLTYYDNYVNI